jgi:hypothetical protein
VTFEDQQKINKFARNNARLQDLKEEMKNKTVHNEKLLVAPNLGLSFQVIQKSVLFRVQI